VFGETRYPSAPDLTRSCTTRPQRNTSRSPRARQDAAVRAHTGCKLSHHLGCVPRNRPQTSLQEAERFVCEETGQAIAQLLSQRFCPRERNWCCCIATLWRDQSSTVSWPIGQESCPRQLVWSTRESCNPAARSPHSRRCAKVI